MENEQKQKNEFNAVTKKVLIILSLVLGLMLPLSQVEDQISSRREYETIAQKEVAKGWGEKVAFSSPVLTISEKNIYPMTSETTITVGSKEKKRGVFQVPVYVATLKTKVTFSKPINQQIEPTKEMNLSEADHIFLSTKPISSIQNFKIRETVSGQEIKAKLVDGGIWLSVNELPNKDIFSNTFEIEISTRGTVVWPEFSGVTFMQRLVV